MPVIFENARAPHEMPKRVRPGGGERPAARRPVLAGRLEQTAAERTHSLGRHHHQWKGRPKYVKQGGLEVSSHGASAFPSPSLRYTCRSMTASHG